MKNRKKSQPAWRKFTFLAPTLSLIALIATILLGIVKGLIAAGLYQVSSPESINRWLIISAAIVVLGLALYGALEPDKVSRFVSRRQTRYGSNLFVTSLAFLGILIVGNVLAYQNPIPIADLTADQENTLAPEMLGALSTLPGKVTAVAFFSNQSSTEGAEKLLGNIKANSNGKFDYRFEDPNQNPLAAREAGITGDGKILLTMGDRKEIAAFADEQEILKALIRLTNPNPRAVYFLTGHGEIALDSGETNFATAKQTLENKNYTVASLNLIADGKIPEEALAIIIGGPQKPLTDKEVDLLKAYVDEGGALVIMQDPYQFTDFGDATDPLAGYLVADWGINFDNDVILDSTNTLGILIAVSAVAYQHPINQGINENLIVAMPQARSITLASAPEGVSQSPLIQTSQPVSNTNFSFGEMDFTESQDSWRYDEGIDLLGPLNMAVAGENLTTGGRVVAIGNSLFASGEYFNAYGNGNFLINAIDWAAEQEDLIEFTPRETTLRTFQPPSQVQWLVILLSSICILPGLIILAGVTTWWQRRRQG